MREHRDAAIDEPSTQPPSERDPITDLLLAASLVAAGLAASAPIWWTQELPQFDFWHGFASGLGLVVAGFIGSRWRLSRHTARLILAGALLYFTQIAVLASVDLLYTIGLVVQGYWMPFVGHAIVAFPEGRLRSGLERGVVRAAYGWSTFVRVGVLFLDPRELGCDSCPQNLLLIGTNAGITTFLQVADSLIPIAVASFVVLIVVRRWRRATSPERRVLNPLFAALALNVLTAIGLYAGFGLRGAEMISMEQLTAIAIVQQTAMLLIPVGLVVSVLRSVLARSAIGNLLVRIGDGRTIAELERDIAWVLGDPSVRIAVVGDKPSDAVDGERRLACGRVTPDGMTLIDEAEGGRAAILHDPSLAQFQPRLLADVAAATRLALDNSSLRAEATLSRSVPAGLAERLQREGGRIGDIGTITISVVMSDIRGYSTIAEDADLHTLATQLNEHRAAMNHAIMGRGGVVMQFVGDAVFAVFGAPDPLDEHALMAVQAAVDMQDAQRGINARWQAAGLEPFPIGIGVTTGPVAAALLGSPEHVEYSVVGDVVNLANRLQAWAADGEIVISNETFGDLGGSIPAEPLPVGTVKGRRGGVVAYRIAVGSATGRSQPAPSFADTVSRG